MIEKTREFLINQIQKYPYMEIQDLLKFLYQSAFGCEHLVSSMEGAIFSVKQEIGANPSFKSMELESLDGAYCRVPLSLINEGLSAETLGKLFFFSAKKEADGKEALVNKLNILEQLIMEKKLPFSIETFKKEKKNWEENGYKAIHHSDRYRENYHPSYRLIAKDYLPFLPFFMEIDRRLQRGTVTVAIEGGSAGGKTTLSKLLKRLYDCTVFSMDDFFLQSHQRTTERYEEIGENIDWERFLEEVLLPLKSRQRITYRKLDCATMTLSEAVSVVPGKLCVIEGAYSMHPKLSSYYDISLFLEIPFFIQKERILRRNGEEMAKRFFSEWIPLENIYFEKTNCKERCDFTILVDQ